MSKQTAVEYLIQYIMNNQYFIGNDLADVFVNAKAMEREQIEEAYYYGQSLNAKSVTSQMIIDNSISYYNETYKGGEQ